MRANIVPLRAVANIITGYADEGESTGSYQYQVIQPANLSDVGPVQTFSLLHRSEPIPEEHVLRQEDVLIKRLNPGIAFFFDRPDIDTIASQNLFVIRANNELIYPAYLGYLLEQPAVLTQFSQLSGSAAAIRAISVKTLYKLALPVVSPEWQQAVGALWLLNKERQRLLSEYAQESNRLMAALYSKIAQ